MSFSSIYLFSKASRDWTDEGHQHQVSAVRESCIALYTTFPAPALQLRLAQCVAGPTGKLLTCVAAASGDFANDCSISKQTSGLFRTFGSTSALASGKRCLRTGLTKLHIGTSNGTRLCCKKTSGIVMELITCRATAAESVLCRFLWRSAAL